MTKSKIPKDWREVKILDVCEVYQPKTISQKDMVKDGKYLVYGANGIIGKCNEFNHEEEEVLVSCRGSCGDLNFSKPKSWITGNAMVISPKNDQLNKKFLYGILTNMNLKKLVSGSVQSQITKVSFNGFKILVPPIKEQQKIAKILSCVDNVIDKTQEIIEGYERVKQGLMDELLVKGIGHKEFKKVKIGFKEIEIPVGWEVKELGEIFEILKSYGISRKHLSEENEIKCFHYGDIHNFKKLFFDVGTEKISNCNYDFFGQREIEFLKEGDVVLVDASEDNIDIGKTISIKNIGDFKCVAGLHTFLLRRKLKNIHIDYSVFLLNNKIIKAEMGKVSTGISVYGISKTNLKKLTSFIPPLPEQKTISKILQTQDNLIQLEKQSLTKLKQIKKGLMQKLLTGEIRVRI